jgi:hypothetical protein
MVNVYSKMKPDSFTLPLQTILTSLFEDIKGVVSARGCTKSKTPRWSGASSRIGLAPDADAADAAAAAAAADAHAASPATSQEGGAAAAPGGDGPASAPSPGGRSGGGRGRAVGGGKQAAGKAQG